MTVRADEIVDYLSTNWNGTVIAKPNMFTSLRESDVVPNTLFVQEEGKASRETITVGVPFYKETQSIAILIAYASEDDRTKYMSEIKRLMRAYSDATADTIVAYAGWTDYYEDDQPVYTILAYEYVVWTT